MIQLSAAMALLALAYHPPVSADQCPASVAEAEQVVSDHHEVTFSTEPQSTIIGEYFDVQVIVCRTDGTAFDGELMVDADMPAHGHGMNYRAAVERESTGGFRAEGMMFHMPGEWRFLFTIVDDTGRFTLEAPLVVQ